MNSDFINTNPDETIIDVLQIVKENKISRLPVVDKNNCLKGIITKSSLVTALSQQFLDTEEVE